MSRFGWAYVNSLITGAVANGPTNSVQFNSGSQVLSGSSNFTFDPSTNTLFLTGTLRADNLIVSSSQILKSGSTIFGDDISDTHQFTGSILGGIVSGTIARFVTITGSTITGSDAKFTTITSQGSTITGSLTVTTNIISKIFLRIILRRLISVYSRMKSAFRQ